MIQFAQPLWIAVGLFFCISVFFTLRILQAKRLQALDRFVSSGLRARLTQNVSSKRRKSKKTLYLLAIFCCFLALARPQYGFKWVEVKRKGIDILFALDTSKSMLAEDIKPNRLERSKFAIMDFVNQLEGDRVGVLPFAGSAYLMCPLTIDYNAFEQSLNAINTSVIPTGGTDIAAAIKKTSEILNNDANHKLLILITDGENLEGDTLKAAEDAAQKGMKIFTVGVGTTEGELIPTTVTGKTGFLKDASGKFITSRLDETSLTKIAEATSGLYVPLGDRGEGLETIYREKLALIPKEELSERRHKLPLERYEWAVAAALIFLITEFMLGGRKTGPLRLPFSLATNGRRAKKKALLSSLLLLLLCTQISETNASEGEEAFKNEDYITALQYYEEALEKDPENFKLHYNYGTTAYKNNLYDDAISSFNTALKSKDLDLQERTYYNRGNAHYKKGVESLQVDPQATIEQWKEAVSSYEASMELAPDAEDSVRNHTLVEKKLKELEKQQEQNKQQDKNQDKKNEENEEKDQNNQEQDQQQDNNQDKDKETKEGDKNDKQDNSQQNDKNSEDKESEKNQEPQKEKSEPKEQKDEKEQSSQASEDEKKEEDAKENAAANAERRKLGKMTKEEAMQLLDGLKNEEGNLNFVPVNDRNSEEPRRDW